MKRLSELVLEAEEQTGNIDTKNKPVKGDAGTYKQWPTFNTTIRGWIKTMSGQEEVKDTFFDGGFLIPTSIQGLGGNTQSKSAILTKQLDSTCKVSISEFSNDFMFLIDGLKPYGYVSTGWSKGKGPGISDIIKSMKAAATENNNSNDNGNDNNNSTSGTM